MHPGGSESGKLIKLCGRWRMQLQSRRHQLQRRKGPIDHLEHAADSALSGGSMPSLGPPLPLSVAGDIMEAVFMVHIHGDGTASWRWHDEPFQAEGGGR
jgi:hypothetical protein